ncbi:hypothetical protein B296_00012386 [Ensete ventricosum]|uniref:BZIP domain-containing protein n=1 Tax=Ensete ventricosum TaxID=4639 RepID=A0A426ZTY9_ENSVE|nr:hypothetical protein B296_00012386 [Ensete ventricosum]
MQGSEGTTAQLPPKAPNTIANNWPYFAHHPAASAALAPHHFFPAHPPVWADEFLDFSATRRNHHRRSASDSVAFLEAPLVDESGGFDRLDDDQLMSMFSHEMPAPPSSSSDQDSINEEPSLCKTEPEAAASGATAAQAGAGSELVVDPKRVKR